MKKITRNIFDHQTSVQKFEAVLQKNEAKASQQRIVTTERLGESVLVKLRAEVASNPYGVFKTKENFLRMKRMIEQE